MKCFLLLPLFLVGCSNGDVLSTYETKTVDVNTLPECTKTSFRKKEGFVSFQADNGDVLKVATVGPYVCLQRAKK